VHILPPKESVRWKDDIGGGRRGKHNGGAKMGRPMNRWIIVAGAILIQLALGAIYAWSAFTTPLAAPLPDTTFEDITVDGGLVFVIDGDLAVGKDSDIYMSFFYNGIETTNITDLDVRLELKNSQGDVVKNDKIVPYLGIVYQEGEPITAGPFTPELDGDAYHFSPRVQKAGCWHYTISVTHNESGNLTIHNFEIVENVGTGSFGFTATQTQLIFAVGLLFFAIFTIIGGRMAAKYGHRNLAIAGGVLLGLGYILASFSGTSFILMVLFIGVLGGMGIGLGYVVPIAIGVKWFPDKKGLVSGLAVAGFGFGALLWVKLCTGFVFGPVKLTGDWGGLFETFTVSQVFLIYGISFLVCVVLGGLVMVSPPKGWKPEGWNPPEQTSSSSGGQEFTSAQMRKTPQYWMLFFMFMVGAGAGLMVIGVIQLFGKYALMNSSNMSSEEAVIIAGTAFALFYSLSNGIGRIVWGAVSDKIGRKWAFVSMFGLQGIVMILFFFVGGYEYPLYIAAAIIGFNFGGNFALFPSATADFFGNKSVGLNYGWVFLSYGFGGLIGPTIGGMMGDMEMWAWAFIPAGVLCLIACATALMLKAPEQAPPMTE